MPLRNRLLGVYKLLRVGGTYIIVERANRNREMIAAPKNFVQGTPKSRIMDIGEIKEDISITAPILVGGGASNDGRALLTLFLAQALNNSSTAVPVLSGATVQVSKEGAQVSIKLKSDGRPASQAFTVTDFPVDNVLDGSSHGILDPIAGSPTRVARFYDFRAKIGKIVYYIMEVTINVEVTIEEKYFIAGNDSNYTGALPSTVPGQNPLASDDTNNPYNFGTQFPFLGVSGIKVTGSGKAAVELNDSVGSDYDFKDYNSSTHQFEAVNVDLTVDGANYELTNQLPGQTITAKDLTGSSTNGFQLQIYDTTNGWTDLIDPTVLNLSKAVVNKADFNVSTGVLENQFGFICWVK